MTSDDSDDFDEMDDTNDTDEARTKGDVAMAQFDIRHL